MRGFIEPCGVGLAGAGQSFDQPEGAHVEGALFAGEAVYARFRGIPVDKAVADQAAVFRLFENRFEGGDHARVRGRHEEDQRHDEKGGVEIFAAVILREGLAFFVPPFGHYFFIDGVAFAHPTMPVAGEGALVGEADTTIQCDPVH